MKFFLTFRKIAKNTAFIPLPTANTNLGDPNERNEKFFRIRREAVQENRSRSPCAGIPRNAGRTNPFGRAGKLHRRHARGGYPDPGRRRFVKGKKKNGKESAIGNDSRLFLFFFGGEQDASALPSPKSNQTLPFLSFR